MALPDEVAADAVPRVATYCASRVPSELADQIRIEHRTRGNTITIYELRPPWREDLGPEWTSSRVCTLQWDPDTELWRIYARDRNDSRLDYPYAEPAASVANLLDELDRDPTGIFWG